MFRIRDPQESLWQSQFLVTPKKAKRLERSWAEVFRNEALPLIDEERFAPMYCVDNGRPNRAVQTVLGVHLLKEMFNLTDDEALEQLEFNLLWHHALRLDIEETHLPQKTLHNFRVRLMQHDGGRLAFQETTDRIIQALGIRTGKQRLDSTHIMSNIATLTRLGLFCETMRLFLRALRWEHPELRPGVPEGLLGRYLKEEDEATHYEDARTGEGRRRLSVCARDLYRLVDRFHGTTAAQLEEYRLLERLLREQCHVGKHQDGRPRDDDDDAGECKVPVALKDPKQVSADSLQSPHDPDVTYSGHKGKGYEVQVAETCHEENATQLITHVEVTPSSGSDTDVSVPVVDGLAERKVRPDELFADTAYGSGRNAFEASRRGTELVSPVAGSAPGNSHEGEGDGPPPLTAADFQIDVTGEQATVCPAGHPSIEEYELKDAPGRYLRSRPHEGITLVLSAADRAVRPAAGIPWPPPLQTTFARQGSSQTGLVTRESKLSAGGTTCQLFGGLFARFAASPDPTKVLDFADSVRALQASAESADEPEIRDAVNGMIESVNNDLGVPDNTIGIHMDAMNQICITNYLEVYMEEVTKGFVN